MPLPAHWMPQIPWVRHEQFFCPDCGDFKGVLADQVRTLKSGKVVGEFRSAAEGVMPPYGAQRTGLSLATGELRCFNDKPGGAGHEAKECTSALVAADVVGCALVVHGKVYMPCRRCGVHQPRDWPPLCPACRPRPELKCHLCGRAAAPFRVTVHRDGGTAELRLCTLDRPAFVDDKQVWDETELMQRINAEHRRRI